MNAGSATIEWLYREQLRVDAEWSVRDATGFTWWADQNAQRIEVVRRDHDPELGESFLIRVRTEVLCDLTSTIGPCRLSGISSCRLLR